MEAQRRFEEVRVWGLGIRKEERVQCLGFRVQGLGFRVYAADAVQPDWKADKVTLQRYRDASAEVRVCGLGFRV